MRQRIVDYTKHFYFARQALSVLIECWAQDRSMPVILITPIGHAETVAKNIRVAFAKEKKKHENRARLNYGFVLSEVFPYSNLDGPKCEAIVIRWRMTQTQNFKNVMHIELPMKGTHA